MPMNDTPAFWLAPKDSGHAVVPFSNLYLSRRVITNMFVLHDVSEVATNSRLDLLDSLGTVGGKELGASPVES